MPQNSSPLPANLVIEFVGPLVDDGGAVSATIAGALVELGVEIRPGAIDQVSGANLDWALGTLLEGHGRHDLLERHDELVARITARWRDALRSRAPRVTPAVAGAWSRLREGGGRVAVLSTLPRELTLEVALAAGLGDLDPIVLDGSGAEGPPRPTGLIELSTRWGIEPAGLHAAVGSAPAMLAAISARCGSVTLVGAPNPQAMLLAERSVASLAELVA